MARDPDDQPSPRDPAPAGDPSSWPDDHERAVGLEAIAAARAAMAQALRRAADAGDWLP